MDGNFFWTTMDIEKHTFWGPLSPDPFAGLISNDIDRYLVVRGKLYRIVPGVPALPTPQEG